MDKIKKYGEGVLRKEAKKVEDIDNDTRNLVNEMKKIMAEKEGLGLAAPQIGVSKRVFVALDKDQNRIITAINPEIVDKQGREIDFEGCLSFPEIFFSIERTKKLVLKAFNENAEEFFIDAEGLLSRCFQHEMDHLNGKLIIDYATEEEKKIFKEKIEGLLKK